MIEAQHLNVEYGPVRVLSDVSLEVHTGEITGLVGESGSGKTTLLRTLMGLVRPSAGGVLFQGSDLAAADMRLFRRRAGMLPQDAAGSLSPRMTLRRLLAEPGVIHAVPTWPRVLELLHRLGLNEAMLDRYPHQISGGQARRVAVIRAMSLGPALLVADEPTAGLDVSVQGDLLNVLLEQQSEGLTLLLSTHNLNAVRRISTRLAVMYLGQIVESGLTAAIFAAPSHPYTAALLSTNPALDPARRRTRITLTGEIPSPAHPPTGCRFHTRCFQAQPRCRVEVPDLRPFDPGAVRCHFPLD